jgi:hypothetical protein
MAKLTIEDITLVNNITSQGSSGVVLGKDSGYGILDTVGDNDLRIRRNGSSILQLETAGVTLTTDLIVEGNITGASGITTLTAEQLLIEDNIITLNSSASGTPVLDSGIEVNRGDSDYARILWDESEDYWVAGISGSEARILTSSGIETGSNYFRPVSDNGMTLGDASHRYSNTYSTSIELDYMSSSAGQALSVNAASGQSIDFSVNDSTYWSILSGGSLQYTGTMNIVANTSDSSDTSKLRLAGGGALGNSRGSYLELGGNEAGGHFDLHMGAAGDGVKLIGSAGNERWRFTQAGDLVAIGASVVRRDNNTGTLALAGGSSTSSSNGAAFHAYGNSHASFAGDAYVITGLSGTATIRTVSSNPINLETNNTLRWAVNSSGYLQGTAGVAVIGVDTSDGSDNSILQLQGGGPQSSTPQNRGGYLRIYGNEHASAGGVDVIGGFGGGYILIGTQAAGQVRLRTNGTNRWSVGATTGHFTPTADATYNLGSSSARVATVYRTAESSSSDERIKENIVTISGASALSKIDNLEPINYTFITALSGIDTSKQRAGFKAQQVHQHIPEAVTSGDNDINNTYGTEGFEIWGMDTDNLLPYLVASIQELKGRIETLEGS